MSKQSQWTVYCHIHRASGRRYVGVTKKTWRARWNQHVYTASKLAKKGWSHFANAIRKYGKDAFDHEVLEVCDSLEEANAAEVRWIKHFDSTNPEKGFNLKKGGDHRPHPVKNPWDRPEYREKWRQDHLQSFIAAGQSSEARAASKAALNTPESRAKRSAAAKASLARPETRKKREALYEDPSFKKKISESLKDSLASDEARARMSEASRCSATPEVRRKRSDAIREAYRDPVVKERHREAVKEAQNRPELIERRRTYRASDETRQKISESSTGRRHTPESIEKQRELYLQRSSSCKFCGAAIEGKRTCINGRVACQNCRGLHDRREASFLRPDRSFLF
jgi:group I intron endonuclease